MISAEVADGYVFYVEVFMIGLMEIMNYAKIVNRVGCDL
tara:strand:+ start:1907 stop:2023 length:117 start_codon:yes stop_codon:yes gene_type:complete